MPDSNFSFELITQDDKARLGKITTPKGFIDTPAFMPVGTQGTVKGVFTDDIKKTIHEISPDVIIHLAAMTGVDLCETEQDLAITINAKATKILAEQAAKNNCFLKTKKSLFSTFKFKL